MNSNHPHNSRSPHVSTRAMLTVGWALLAVVASILTLQSQAREPSIASSTVKFPSELIEFTPYKSNPIFTGAGPDHWDAKIRERGWIMRDGDRWNMWYTGYDGTREGKRMLGHATSSDGLIWTRDEHNPVYGDHTIEDMMVVRDGGKYYMFAEEGDLTSQWLTSPDDINWTRQGTLDIRKSNGKPLSPGPVGTPTVWREGSTWYLLYERGDRAVWLASTKDLKVWTNVEDDPVLKPGPEKYDREVIAVNQVIKYDDRYYAYYHGSGDAERPRKWSTNVATSTDRIHWKKYPHNPIVPGDRSSGIVVPDGPSGDAKNDSKPVRFRLYTMHDKVEAFLPATPAK